MHMERGNLKEDEVTVKCCLKAVVCFNGEVMSVDNGNKPSVNYDFLKDYVKPYLNREN